MLDLLTRLADALEAHERQVWLFAERSGPEFTPSTQLTEARRAIAETRVIELPECFIAGTNPKRHWLRLGVDNVLDCGMALPAEPEALEGLPHNAPADVTILVRAGGSNG